MGIHLKKTAVIVHVNTVFTEAVASSDTDIKPRGRRSVKSYRTAYGIHTIRKIPSERCTQKIVGRNTGRKMQFVWNAAIVHRIRKFQRQFFDFDYLNESVRTLRRGNDEPISRRVLHDCVRIRHNGAAQTACRLPRIAHGRLRVGVYADLNQISGACNLAFQCIGMRIQKNDTLCQSVGTPTSIMLISNQRNVVNSALGINMFRIYFC